MREDAVLCRLPELLLPWYAANARDLPWRKDREPYHVWLSEIMLQQTRVEAVKPYYLRFLAQLPQVGDLARCEDDALMKLWEGLGYYSRARNLKKAAQVIAEQYHGVFPADHKKLLALPGVGDYTAGAVASICFELPEPAVDGNVLRVISRLCADGRCVDDAAVKKEIRGLLLPVYEACSHRGTLTQALMELGATICIPNGKPLCDVCPCKAVCRARQEGSVDQYPVRKQKKPRKIEKYTVYVLRCGDEIALQKRPAKGLLAGLWELPHTDGHCSMQQALRMAESWGCHPTEAVSVTGCTHIFTHIEWHMQSIYLLCSRRCEGFTWISLQSLAEETPLPTAFRVALPDFEQI